MSTALIVLAAGQGTRMKSDRPKVLHELAGMPLFRHALASGAALKPERTVLVVGPESGAVSEAAKACDPGIDIIEQNERLGTGHAALQAKPALDGFDGDAVILYADTPFITPRTLSDMRKARQQGGDVVVLGFEAADPGRYGRLVTEGSELLRIVEFNDASESERAITLCNSGVVMTKSELMLNLCAKLSNENASGEYYLTDMVELARSQGMKATVVTCGEEETLGVNTRADLAAAEAVFQRRARKAAAENGATLTAPETVFFSHDTKLGRDVTVEPNVVFGPGVSIEAGARIRAFSHLEGCIVGAGAAVGPFARIRPGTELANGVHVGNFVEIKNATLGDGAKANHLAYIGDASVGAGSNIGAGTVTCNYNGVEKQRTEIGKRAFIGSDTMLVAPVRVGDDAMTASGSVITRDVPEGALALGRADQTIKPDAARRLLGKRRKAPPR